MAFEIGQRVHTKKYGWGTIRGFEWLMANGKAQISTHWHAGDRIAVEVDEPERWPCHSQSSGYPMFMMTEHTKDFLE